jgi:hypothetical protein
MAHADMVKLEDAINKTLHNHHITVTSFEEGSDPGVISAHLDPVDLAAIREIQNKYHAGEPVSYEGCMDSYSVKVIPEENGVLFIDFPGSRYPNGLGLDVLPPHTHQAGRIVANVGTVPGTFHYLTKTGEYREQVFAPGDVVGFTGNVHTFTTKQDMVVLAFHLPFYDLENDPRAFTLYEGDFA